MMNNPRQMALIKTTHVALIRSLRGVQETLFNSASTSSMNVLILFIIINTQARQDSNLQPAVLETVALPVRATGLYLRILLFHFLVRQMLLAKRTILFKLKAFGLFLLVLHARIIDALTCCALKMNDLSHKSCLVFTPKLEPSTRIELVTSSLPRTCSTN